MSPAVEGVRAAQFHALFSNEFPWMWTTLRRLGVKPGDVEDVAHDVFMQVFRKFETYDPARPRRPWLFAFAYRTASDYRRLARHRELPTEELPEAPSSSPTALDLMEREERGALVHDALATLDFERRAVLVAFEMDGTPMKDIAEALQIPLNTAYSRLRLAREDFTAAVRRLAAKQGTPIARGDA